MLDISVANIIHSNVPNFLLLLVIIGAVLYKIDINSMLEKLRKNVEDSVKESERQKSQAYSSLKDAKLQDATTPHELANIQENSVNTLKSLQEKIMEDAKEQVSHIEKNVEKIVDSEKDKVRSSLAKGLSKASVELAEHNIVKMLENNIDLHNNFIAQAIDELDEVGL